MEATRGPGGGKSEDSHAKTVTAAVLLATTHQCVDRVDLAWIASSIIVELDGAGIDTAVSWALPPPPPTCACATVIDLTKFDAVW